MRMIDMIDNTYMYGRYTELIQYHSIQIPSTIMYLSLDYFDNCSLPKNIWNGNSFFSNTMTYIYNGRTLGTKGLTNTLHT